MPVYGECCERECFERGEYCPIIEASDVSYYPLAPAPAAPPALAPVPAVGAPEGDEE